MANTQNVTAPGGRAVGPLLLVLAATLVLAAGLYARFRAVDRLLWFNPHHDRHAHYLYGQKLANAVNQGHVIQLARELNGARVWPPLHGVLLAGVLLVGGFDYRLGVLPSLTGWVLTVVFGYLVARRAVPRGGLVAGLAAALFISTSPAHRLYATDIMLESLGAGLTLMVLHCYLVTAQEQTRTAGRCLGLALTALFYHKYNYWLLVALALTASEAVAHRHALLAGVRSLRLPFPVRDWWVAQARHPLNALLLVGLVLLAAVVVRGSEPLWIGGRPVSLYPPHVLLTVVYVLVFLRLFPWWRREGGTLSRKLPSPLQPLLAWHAGPVLLGFLLPKRLGYFLWFLSPANTLAGCAETNPLRAAADYAAVVARDYHVGTAGAWLAVGLAGVALLTVRGWRRGGPAILWLAGLATVLTCSHPNHQSRFVHSWIAAAWVVAGIGLAALLDRVPWPRLRLASATIGLAALLGALAPGVLPDPDPKLTGIWPRRSLLDVTDYYLANLTESRRTCILATAPIRYLSEWTFLDRFGSWARLETHWFGFARSDAENGAAFARWLRETSCDTLVFVEGLPGSAYMPPTSIESTHQAPLRALLDSQEAFRLVRRQEFPGFGYAVTIWKDPTRTVSAPGTPASTARVR